MSSYQLVDLPFELQIEIFSNILSIKHLVKVLSLNKSTHDQLVQSKIFWNNLINNYSKPFRSSATSKLLSSDDELNVHIKNQFYELRVMKQCQTKLLAKGMLEFECTIRELEMVKLEEIEKTLQTGVVNDQMNLKVEKLQQEIESIKIKKKEIEEKFKKMKID